MVGLQFVVPELQAVQVLVGTVPGHQFFVGTLLGDPTVIDDGDGVCPHGLDGPRPAGSRRGGSA